MGLFRKKSTKSKTDDEMFADALGQLSTDLERRDRRRKRRQARLMLPAWLDSRILVGLGVIVVIILADAVRRENEEFTATLTGYLGQVTVQEKEGAVGQWPTTNQQLADGNVVNAGAKSYAVIEFPDGSVTTLGENSQLIVKLLEYSRGGQWRSRAFMLRVGQMWSNVGPHFGKESEMKVYTPSAVAAVRGTRYAVSHDPKKKTTSVQCSDGYVEVAGFTGRPMYVRGGSASEIRYGQPAKDPRWMTDKERTAFAQEWLNRPIPPEEWIKTTELTLTQLLDGPLSILGIGKCSWGVGTANYARRTAAMEQLRRIAQFMEGYAKYPEMVNPATLEPLAIPYDEARRMLKAFHGDALTRYDWVDGGRSYRIEVQARDRKRTTFVLTPVGISSEE